MNARKYYRHFLKKKGKICNFMLQFFCFIAEWLTNFICCFTINKMFKEDKKKDTKYIKRVNIYRKDIPLWLHSTLKALFIAFIICCAIIAIFNFVYIGRKVDGSSMLPTLNNYEDKSISDCVYINRFATSYDGDIIVVHNPTNNSNANKYVIKRLMATSGDKIAIIRTDNGGVSASDGTYKISRIKKDSSNAELVEETYLDENTSLYFSYLEFQSLLNKPDLTGCKVVTINGIKYLEIDEGYIFYMGDNRSSKEASYDCLDYGPVEANKIVGRVNIIVYENKNHFSQIFSYFIHKIFG